MFLNRLKIGHQIVPLLLCVFSPYPSLALDDNGLWLPVSHEKFYLALKNAAQNAENLDRCESVLRGTLDFDQSTEEQPIFRILCRQPNGKTYNEMVDGLTGTPLTTIVENDSDTLNGDQKGKEQRILEAIEAKQQELSDACLSKSQEKIQLFSSVTMIEREKTLISYTHNDVSDDFVVSGAKAVYRRDFDAKDIEERHLSYKIVCVISGGENDSPLDISVRVKKRRD